MRAMSAESATGDSPHLTHIEHGAPQVSSANLPSTTPPSSPPDLGRDERAVVAPPSKPTPTAARKRSNEEISRDDLPVDNVSIEGDDHLAQAAKGKLLDQTMNHESSTPPKSDARDSASTSNFQAPHRDVATPASDQASQPQHDSRLNKLGQSRDACGFSSTSQTTLHGPHTDEDQPKCSPDDVEEEPQDRIYSFDWQSLQNRYRKRLEELENKETNLWQEYQCLIQCFEAWANAGSAKETDRGIKRLRTHTMYVENEETELEKKRQHYVRVVNAFKSALNLLEEH